MWLKSKSKEEKGKERRRRKRDWKKSEEETKAQALEINRVICKGQKIVKVQRLRSQATMLKIISQT